MERELSIRSDGREKLGSQLEKVKSIFLRVSLNKKENARQQAFQRWRFVMREDKKTRVRIELAK
jgi:hypothetical protein